jgi:hypothetical protein
MLRGSLEGVNCCAPAGPWRRFWQLIAGIDKLRLCASVRCLNPIALTRISIRGPGGVLISRARLLNRRSAAKSIHTYRPALDGTQTRYESVCILNYSPTARPNQFLNLLGFGELSRLFCFVSWNRTAVGSGRGS